MPREPNAASPMTTGPVGSERVQHAEKAKPFARGNPKPPEPQTLTNARQKAHCLVQSLGARAKIFRESRFEEVSEDRHTAPPDPASLRGRRSRR